MDNSNANKELIDTLSGLTLGDETPTNATTNRPVIPPSLGSTGRNFSTWGSPAPLLNSPTFGKISTPSGHKKLAPVPALKEGGSGVIKDPWIVEVNINNPKRTRKFDVVFVTGIKENGKIHNGFHIRKIIAIADVNEWEASIPLGLPGLLRGIEGRCVMVKGPSRPIWFRDQGLYHRSLFCAATADVHSATQLKIESNPTQCRGKSYWILMFPEGTLLDNNIFSGNYRAVKQNVVPMKMKAGNKDALAMGIYWLVANAGGRRVKAAKKADANLDDMYNF